ncbi:hypothetical protein Ahia01_000352700 [Argonauta hians]
MEEEQCTRLKSVVIQNNHPHNKWEKQKPPKRTNRYQSKSEHTASKRRDSSTQSREQNHSWHRSFDVHSSDNQSYSRKKSHQNLSKSKNNRSSKHLEDDRRCCSHSSNSHDYESSKNIEPSQNSPPKRQSSSKKSFHDSRSRERDNLTVYKSFPCEWNHTMEDYSAYQQNFWEYDESLWVNEYTEPNLALFLPLNYDKGQNTTITQQTTLEPTGCYYPDQGLTLPKEQPYAIHKPTDEVFNGTFYNYDFPYSFLKFRDDKNWINPPIENKVIQCTSYPNFPVDSFFSPPGEFIQNTTSNMDFHPDSVHYMFRQMPQLCESYIPVRQHIIPPIPQSSNTVTKDSSNEFDEALKRIMMEQFSLFTNFTPQFSTWCLECCDWDYGKAADSFIYNRTVMKRIPYMAYNT